MITVGQVNYISASWTHTFLRRIDKLKNNMETNNNWQKKNNNWQFQKIIWSAIFRHISSETPSTSCIYLLIRASKPLKRPFDASTNELVEISGIESLKNRLDCGLFLKCFRRCKSIYCSTMCWFHKKVQVHNQIPNDNL